MVELRKHLSYSVPGAYHAPQYKRYLVWRKAYARAVQSKKLKRPDVIQYLTRLKRGTWDGKKQVYTEYPDCIVFPTPLVHMLKQLGWFKKHNVRRTRKRFTLPKSNVKYRLPDFPEEVKGRDYSFQDQCVKLFTDGGLRFGMLHLAPAAGKSEIAAKIILELGLRAVVTAPGKTEAKVIYDRLAGYFGGKSVGLYGLGRKDVKDITVVCWASVRGRKLPGKLFERPLWIGDECHREVGAQTKFADNSIAVYRIGMSATIPKNKAKRLELEAIFGPEIRRINEKELEKRRVTSKTTHVFLRYDKPTDYREYHEKMNYLPFYRRWIVNNPVRNKRGVEQVVKEVKAGGRGLVFIRRLRHGRIIESRLKRKGIRCEYLRGDVSDEERLRAQNRLRKGRLDVLVGTGVISTGMSINEVTFTLSLTGEYAMARLKQEKGRAARWMKGKVSTNYEMLDTFSERLYTHTRKRIRVLKSTGCKVVIEKE